MVRSSSRLEKQQIPDVKGLSVASGHTGGKKTWTHNSFLMDPVPSGSRTLKAERITSSGSAPSMKKEEEKLNLHLEKKKQISLFLSGCPPFSFSPNMVRKTVKLMGPLASLIMASSSSFFTFSWPDQSKRQRQTTSFVEEQILLRENTHPLMPARL